MCELTCEGGGAVNQMSPYSMLVLVETVGVLARCLGVHVFVCIFYSC